MVIRARLWLLRIVFEEQDGVEEEEKEAEFGKPCGLVLNFPKFSKLVQLKLSRSSLFSVLSPPALAQGREKVPQKFVLGRVFVFTKVNILTKGRLN